MLKYDQDDVNAFRRSGSGMRREIRMILLVLAAWLLAILGFQGVVYLLEYTRYGAGVTAYTFFNMPIPYWLTGQLLPLWFILLCVVFNLWMDRNVIGTPDRTLRFRARGDAEREE